MSDDFVKAVFLGKIDEAHNILATSIIDINHVHTKLKQTALYAAVGKRRYDLVALVLQQPGVKCNLTEGLTNKTPLMLASTNADLPSMELLIPRSDLTITNAEGLTAYDQVLWRISAVKTQQEREQLILASNMLRNATMHSALEHGNFKLFNRMLLEEHTDVNSLNHRGETALFVAAHNGLSAFVGLLLRQSNIQINAITKGSNALLAVLHDFGDGELVARQRIEIAKDLVKRGADVNFVNASREGEFALFLAISQFGKMPDCIGLVKALLEKGAGPSVNYPCPERHYKKLAKDVDVSRLQLPRGHLIIEHDGEKYEAWNTPTHTIMDVIQSDRVRPTIQLLLLELIKPHFKSAPTQIVPMSISPPKGAPLPRAVPPALVVPPPQQFVARRAPAAAAPAAQFFRLPPAPGTTSAPMNPAGARPPQYSGLGVCPRN